MAYHPYKLNANTPAATIRHPFPAKLGFLAFPRRVEGVGPVQPGTNVAEHTFPRRLHSWTIGPYDKRPIPPPLSLCSHLDTVLQAFRTSVTTALQGGRNLFEEIASRAEETSKKAWEQPGKSLGTAWKKPGKSLGTAWKKPGNSLQKAWKIFFIFPLFPFFLETT